MVYLLTATYGRTASTYGSFTDARKAERACKALETTLLFDEVIVETIGVYDSVDAWRNKEYPEEAASLSNVLEP